jgi:GH24 family phage-related lysozyme (muramidase)
MDQWSFTAPFEGIVSHMYLDTAGLVTCGVGFMLPDETACARVRWAPNQQYAAADFRQVKQAERGHAASFYAQYCRASLSEPVMREIFDRRVAEFRQGLQPWMLGTLPEQAQIALVDMTYNLGVAGLNKYVNLKAAIVARDWRTATNECKRGGISMVRNSATQGLFLQCLSVV